MSLSLQPIARRLRHHAPPLQAPDEYTIAMLMPGQQPTVIDRTGNLTLAIALARGCLLDSLGCAVVIFQPAPELEVDAAEIRIRAERRLGEMLAATKATVGLAPAGRPKKIGSRKEPIITTPTLAAAGIDKKLSSRAQKLAAVGHAPAMLKGGAN
ncbi:MAG TPA: hypothetical protein VMP01_08975 [Pirellulaceae bacterium]|nr:hypothetical protein [Pirellulaceae bacterium]